MSKHEQKQCSRCKIAFECKAGSIMQCQCSAINLTVEERAYIEAKYDDCLCIECLSTLQKKYIQFKEKYILKK